MKDNDDATTLAAKLAGLLTSGAAELYQQLLQTPALSVPDSPARAELIDQGLARPLASTGELYALPPEPALSRLLHRAAEAWLAQAPNFGSVRAAIASLDGRSVVTPTPASLSTSIEKQQTVERLLATARRSVWTLQPYPDWMPDEELANQDNWSANFSEAGVTYRYVYDDRLMRFDSFHEMALREAALGVQIRLANWQLPTYLMIVDGSTTVYFPQRRGNGVVATGAPMVGLLELAFEQAWNRSVPLRQDADLEPDHLKVHTLVAAGHTAPQIARLLGVNERTVRRRVADLMAHYRTTKPGLIRIGDTEDPIEHNEGHDNA